MKFNSTLVAALLGLSLLGVPALASAHPNRFHAYHRAMMSARFNSMSHWQRHRFLSNHPYLASHRWMLNPGGKQAARAARWNRWQRGAWNNSYEGAYGQEPDGDEAAAPGYANVPPGWRHHEPDRDDYRSACGGDGDGDDCGPAAYSYGGQAYGNGYGYRGAPYGNGYGSPYYGSSYGANAWSNMLPMIQRFIP